MELRSIVDYLVRLNDDNLADEVVNGSDVQWCLSELQDILVAMGDLTGDRLHELAEADKAGRVVVLPCKVGDKLYEVTGRKTISVYRVKAIRVELFVLFIEWDIEEGFVWQSLAGVSAEEIGKTVFLTREEAERALEEAKRDE